MEREVLTLEDIDRLFMEMGEKAIEEDYHMTEEEREEIDFITMPDEELKLLDEEVNYFPY